MLPRGAFRIHSIQEEVSIVNGSFLSFKTLRRIDFPYTLFRRPKRTLTNCVLQSLCLSQPHHFIMRSLLYLINITPGASALYINPNGRTQNSTRLATRTDPSLSNVNHLASHLAKRTDPRFYDGDYGDNWDGVNKREALQDAFSDVYYMVLTALQTFDNTIFGHWFPARDRDKVFNVLRQVVGDDLVSSSILAKSRLFY